MDEKTWRNIDESNTGIKTYKATIGVKSLAPSVSPSFVKLIQAIIPRIFAATEERINEIFPPSFEKDSPDTIAINPKIAAVANCPAELDIAISNDDKLLPK